MRVQTTQPLAGNLLHIQEINMTKPTPTNEDLRQAIIEIASVVQMLTCMVDSRPSTLPPDGQDWFEAHLKSMHQQMFDILQRF